jgi:hypothetical protein
MSENLGRGIYLTNSEDLSPQWDLKVDATGDIRTTFNGESELQKDLALATTVRLQDSVGERIDPVTLNRTKARLRNALRDEDRIEAVVLTEVRGADSNKIEAVTRALTTDGEVELVFLVDNL